MHTTLIPKQPLTAYERWEKAALEDFEMAAEVHPCPTSAPSEAAEPPPALSEEELNAIRAQAREEALVQGREQGYADGLAAGREQARLERQRLQDIARSFTQEAEQAHETVAQDLLDLALELARALLHTALDTQPALLLPIVKDAIRYLPTLQPPAQLFLNPADAQLVRAELGEELTSHGWRIQSDSQIQRGGCRVETGSNQIDATLETRWQRLTTALGKETAWLMA